MLGTYIRVTGNAARYLLFLLMDFFGPLARLVFGLFGIGGILGFLFMLIARFDHPRADVAMYALLASGLIGMTLMMQYDIVLTRMYYDRLNADLEDEDDEKIVVPWWKTMLNWLAVFALLAGSCMAANWYFGLALYHIKGIIVGAACWLVLGIALNVARWFYGLTRGVLAAAAGGTRKAVGSVASWAKKKAPVHKAAGPENNVVQFRKR